LRRKYLLGRTTMRWSDLSLLALCFTLACKAGEVSAPGTAGGSGGRAGATSVISLGGIGGTLTIGSPTPQASGQTSAPQACDNPTACPDFPADPILDTGAPSNAASQFSGSPSGTGPCVVEPEDGSLFPYNWVRPRIRWTGTSGLTQITMHADLEAHDLVAYTTASFWLVPKDVWAGLSQHVHESDITVTVRAAKGGATTVKFQIASANAAGSIVFWAADPAAVGNQNVTTVQDTTSLLLGFSVGEEGSSPALKFSQVKQPSRDQSYNKRTPTCIGCHAATPNKGYVAFIDNWPWNSVIAGVTPDIVGDELPDLSDGGLAALNKPWAGPATFSGAYWQTGSRMMVATAAGSDESQPWSTDDKLPAKLVWYNLDSPAPPALQNVPQGPVAQVSAGNYGIINRNGDPNAGVAFPTWSHDGKNIVYSSTNGGCMDGRLQQGATDLYVVPYNEGNGGSASPVPGASDKSWEEYYAAYSPDDQLVLFNRVPSGQVMYANPNAEIFFAPMPGAPGAGTPVRLKANDPPQCAGAPSPGINNHFPKWAPASALYNGRTYYWVIFSSNRAGLPPVKSPYDGKDHQISQLYLTAVSVENGQYTTYHSIYLWNQPTTSINTTPVWDMLVVPPAPTVYIF